MERSRRALPATQRCGHHIGLAPRPPLRLVVEPNPNRLGVHLALMRSPAAEATKKGSTEPRLPSGPRQGACNPAHGRHSHTGARLKHCGYIEGPVGPICRFSEGQHLTLARQARLFWRVRPAVIRALVPFMSEPKTEALHFPRASFGNHALKYPAPSQAAFLGSVGWAQPTIHSGITCEWSREVGSAHPTRNRLQPHNPGLTAARRGATITSVPFNADTLMKLLALRHGRYSSAGNAEGSQACCR